MCDWRTCVAGVQLPGAGLGLGHLRQAKECTQASGTGVLRVFGKTEGNEITYGWSGPLQAWATESGSSLRVL